MNERLNNIPEKNKALLRLVVGSTSIMFLVLALYLGIYPQHAADFLAMDLEVVTILSYALAVIAMTDFVIAFILFKPKDRV